MRRTRRKWDRTVIPVLPPPACPWSALDVRLLAALAPVIQVDPRPAACVIAGAARMALNLPWPLLINALISSTPVSASCSGESSYCTELTLKCQGNLVRLPSATRAPLALASLSRSQDDLCPASADAACSCWLLSAGAH